MQKLLLLTLFSTFPLFSADFNLKDQKIDDLFSYIDGVEGEKVPEEDIWWPGKPHHPHTP